MTGDPCETCGFMNTDVCERWKCAAWARWEWHNHIHKKKAEEV